MQNMFETRSGTSADIDATAAFLTANALSSEALRDGHADEPGALYTIAWRDGCVIGFARGSQARESSGVGASIPGTFHVNTVIVGPGSRRESVGLSLIDKLLADAADKGFNSAQLWVHTDNAAALGLYRKFGFVQRDTAVEHERLGSLQRMTAALAPSN